MSYRTRNLKALVKKIGPLRSTYAYVRSVTRLPSIYSLVRRHPRAFASAGGAPFYIARRTNSTAGIFSHYVCLLGHVRYALQIGRVPVVDMRTVYSHLYHEEDEAGSINAWEKFFTQPTEATLDAAAAEAATLVNTDDWAANYVIDFDTLARPGELAAYRAIASTHFGLQPEVRQYVDRMYAALFPAGARVLGVSYRSGYAMGRPFGHAIQPPIEAVADDVENVLRAEGFSHVFLAVESEEIVDAFRRQFGDRLITIDRPRVNAKSTPSLRSPSAADERYLSHITGLIEPGRITNLDSYMECASFGRPNEKFAKGLEYIAEVVLLSRCSGLLASQSGGVLAAMLLKDKDYAFQKIYSLGDYGIDDMSYWQLFYGALAGRGR